MGRLNFSNKFLLVLVFSMLSNLIYANEFNSYLAPPDSLGPPDSLLKGREMIDADIVLSPIYARENVPARLPIPYHHLREADVMWKKKVWRILNLKEKINHPLYYPVNKQPYDNRYSLLDLIIFGVSSPPPDEVPVYEDDNFATIPISKGQFAANLGASVERIGVERLDEPGIYDSTWTDEPVKSEQITRFEMKEVWFFDKQRSKLEVRIVALGPIREYIDDISGELMHARAGWIPYKRLRPLFANQEVFNPKNDAERRTFGDVFNKRHFSSYIVQETNVYEDRKINLYKKGQDALLEGDRVKQFIFKVEHDLWEF